MDRREIILIGIDVHHSKGLEIGPLRNPIVQKCDGEVFYLDHLPTEELMLKYQGHNFDVNEIVNVDYVLKSGLSLSETLGKRNYFDYVIASHVFEHIPNPISWMEEIWEILSPDGKLSLAIPDKRFCFDYFRSPSNTGDLIEPYLNKSSQPSTRSVFDAISNAVTYEGSIAWSTHINAERLQKISTLQQALEVAKNVANHKIYHDVHSWCFTPNSFFKIIRELMQLRLLNFSVLQFSNTLGCEFFVTFRKENKDAISSTLLDTVPAFLEEETLIPRDFNSQLYLNLNPDVASAGVDPVQHFIHYGKVENRRYK